MIQMQLFMRKSVDCVTCSICHCSDRSVYRFSKDLLMFPEDKIRKLPRTRPYFDFVCCFVFQMSMMHESQM